MVMMKDSPSQPCDLSVKPKDYSLPPPPSSVVGMMPVSSAATGLQLKRKAVCRDSIEDEYDEDEDIVTSSSGAIKAAPGKRSRKEGVYVCDS